MFNRKLNSPSYSEVKRQPNGNELQFRLIRCDVLRPKKLNKLKNLNVNLRI